MQRNALFMGWNTPKAGREAQAGELFQAVVSFWSEHQQDGNIDSFEPVILAPHGGDMNGFFLVRGPAENLTEIRGSDEYRKIEMQCGYVLEGFGTILGMQGDSAANFVGEWRQMVSSS